MITAENLIEAREFLRSNWGEAGTRVIEEAEKVEPFNGYTKAFLEHCTACGGDWGGMLLTGVRELWPTVWDAIPNNMGVFAFPCILFTLQLCGVDTSE